MLLRAVFSLLLLFAFMANAQIDQNISISGKVLTGSASGEVDSAVVGAKVELPVAGISAESGTDGTYALTYSGIVKKTLITPDAGKIILNRGVLELCLTNPSPVKVEIFDIKGHLLKREVMHNASAGLYRLNILENSFASKMLIINASIGQSATTLRYVPMSNGKFMAHASIKDFKPVSSKLTKVSEVINDTIITIADGYDTSKVAITSYNLENMDITLTASTQSDIQSVSLSFLERGVHEGCGELRLAATIAVSSASDLSVPFSLGGSCESGSDYTAGDTVFNFAAGQTRCTTTVTIINDTEVEEAETLQVTLQPTSTVALGDTSKLNIIIYSDDGEEHSIHKCVIAGNDLEGWTQSIYASDLVATKGEELFGIINGGAVPYIENGYSNGFRQTIDGPDETSLSFMAMNFLTEEKCNALYSAKAAEQGDGIEIPGISTELATGSSNLGGITVYTRTGPYYFELVLSGYSSQDDAVQMAKTFIDLFTARLAN